MSSLPIISSHYLRPAFKLVEDSSTYFGYLHKASLPPRLPDYPFFIPLFAAFEVYKSIVCQLGLEHSLKRIVSLANDESLFDDCKNRLPLSFPSPPARILPQWISIIRQSNCDSAATNFGDDQNWFIFRTCRLYKDTFLQDMIEIGWLQLAISCLIPSFVPKRFRIRASGNKERKLWTKAHISAPVEFSHHSIAIEISEKDLFFQSPINQRARSNSEKESSVLVPGAIPNSFSESLVAILMSYSPDRWLTIEDFAEITNTSARSIQRYLLESGTSFRKITIETKIKLAKKALEHSNASISKIALDLGFSAPSSFTRCFVNFTGIPPIEYRRLAKESTSNDSLLVTQNQTKIATSY